MTGLDDEDEGPENFRPAPHPDDRLWRHPSEMAAFLAGQAAASVDGPVESSTNPQSDITVELPAVSATRATGAPSVEKRTPARSGRVHRGLIAAAAAVAVGATALTVGALSSRAESDRATYVTAEPAVARRDATPPANAVTAVSNPAPIADSEIPLVENGTAVRLHDQVADSLPRIQAASGSGMVEGSGLFVTVDGHIATSASLIADSDYVLAWTNDGRRLPATIIAVDRFSDVAVLHVDTSSRPVDLHDLDRTTASDTQAMVIDYDSASLEFGAIASLTAVAQPASGLGDASSRLRFSHGALPGSAIIDASGSVLAMANFGSDERPDLNATPAWMVKRVVDQLLDRGVAMHPWLGVQIVPEPDGIHARVTQVVAGSPAERAGVQVDDLIDAIDGESLDSAVSVWTLIQRRRPGDSVSLAVTRNGERRLISAQLEALVN